MEAIIFTIVGALIGFLILYSVIKMAVRNALAEHYKVVRRFEATGEWVKSAGGANEAPRALPAPPTNLVRPPKNLS